MKHSTLIVHLLLLLPFSETTTYAQDFSNVEIKVVPVAGCVHMLSGYGGNIGVCAGSDGVVIVDDQFAPLAEKIRKALGSLGSSKPAYIINTHWHGDHVGGNEIFAVDGTIIAHTNVRKRMASGGKLAGRIVDPAPKGALPVITFDESMSVHFNGEEIRATYVKPSHTDGDSIIYFVDSGVVHFGDLFFSGMFPFVDLESGGSVSGLIDTVKEALRDLPQAVKIIPGHGPLSTKADLERYYEMLVATRAIVAERKGRGMTLAEVQQEGLSDEWAPWSWTFISTERWLEILYNSP